MEQCYCALLPLDTVYAVAGYVEKNVVALEEERAMVVVECASLKHLADVLVHDSD